ncbi:MAG TPA: hypothetical protein VFM80_06185 [Gracilimonas sp.]|uniref:hypothetical protein n=1 Tax=Gracilimonas sp. TaxID=1974203 RepID=UPI002D95B6D6|nr:hypothetical protein [Gracilimonas sp.]
MKIEIPEPLFHRLQKHAIPLVDNIPSVITKILDKYEEYENIDGVKNSLKQKKISMMIV